MIRYGEPLAEQCAVVEVDSRGDSYDYALADTLNSLFKAEAIRHLEPWKGIYRRRRVRDRGVGPRAEHLPPHLTHGGLPPEVFRAALHPRDTAGGGKAPDILNARSLPLHKNQSLARCSSRRCGSEWKWKEQVDEPLGRQCSLTGLPAGVMAAAPGPTSSIHLSCEIGA